MTDNELKAAEISQRIAQLESTSAENLKHEMQELKKALLENPAACLLLLEEDIGTMVTHLRKVTGAAIVSAATKKPRAAGAPKATSRKLTAAELAAALDDEDF